MEHTKTSPSGRHRWGACPGSVREEQKYPDNSGPAAIDGTHTHNLLSYCLRTGTEAKDHIGKTLKWNGDEFSVDAARAERVEFTLAYINKRMVENPEFQLQYDIQVEPENLLSRPGLGGTVDVLLMSPTEIEIIDLKDGMHPVSALKNPQMEQYLFGAVTEHYKQYMSDLPSIVRKTIIQPKLRVMGQPGVSTHEMNYVQFAEGIPMIQAQYDATLDPNAPLVPGVEQCRYCRAKGDCTTFINSALTGSGIKFDAANLAQQTVDQDHTTLSNAKLREIIESIPLLRQAIAAAEEEVLKRFQAGNPVDGLKMVRGPGRREWMTKNDDEMAAKLIALGIPKGTVYKEVLISPAAADNLIWTKRDGSVVVLSARQRKVLDAEYIKKGEGKLTVVVDSDSRPSVQGGVAHLFATVAIAPPVTVKPELPSWMLPRS